MHNQNGGPIYTVPLIAASLTTAGAYDLVGLVADSSARFEIASIELTLASTQFSSGAGLAITIQRGSTGTSTGASIAAKNVKGWSGSPTPAFTASGPSTTLVSTASAVVVHCDSFDGRGRFYYRPKSREERITITLGQRLFLRTTTPSIAATVNGTILVSETGKGLPS